MIRAAGRGVAPQIVHHSLEPRGARTRGGQCGIVTILDLGRNQQRRIALAQQGIDLARVGPQRQQRRRHLARHARPLLARQPSARRDREAHPAASDAATRMPAAQRLQAAARPALQWPSRRHAGRAARHQRADREQHARAKRHQQPCRNGDGRFSKQIQRIERQQRERQPGDHVVVLGLQHRRSRQSEQYHMQPGDRLRRDADSEHHHAELRHASERHGAPPVEPRPQRDGTNQQRRQAECDQQPRKRCSDA